MAAISPRLTTPTTTTTISFCVAKRKKGINERDKEFQSRNYEKAATKVKMLLFYPFQNVFNSKILLVCQSGWLAILFKVSWPLHFEIHFTPVILNLKLLQVLYFILHQAINTTFRSVTREEKGGGLPSPFSKFKKIALILEKKKALTTFIHELNFSLNMLFLSVSRKKSPKFFPAGPFFHVLQIICLSKCLYFEKPPLPRKTPGYAPEMQPLPVSK